MNQEQNLFWNYLEQQQEISLENQRKIQDASFTTNVALAGNTNTTQNTASFNLIQSYAASEHYAVEFDIDSTATVPSAATVTVTVQGSADNSTWANITELATTTFTGNASNVVANTSVIYRLSPDTPQYIRGQVVVGALGASPTGNVVFSLRF